MIDLEPRVKMLSLSRRAVIKAGIAIPFLAAMPIRVFAQATPGSIATSGVDLPAAMPRASDVPRGFHASYDAMFDPVDYPLQVTDAERATMGLQRVYHQAYGAPDAPIGAFVVVREFSSPEGAEEFVSIVSNVARYQAANPATISATAVTEADGRQVIVSTTDYRGQGALVVESAETFIADGPYVVSASADHFLDASDAANSEAIEAALATPVVVTEIQTARIEPAFAFADATMKRLRQVLTGVPPAGVDPAWPAATLDVSGWLAEGAPLPEAYRDSWTIWDPNGSLKGFATRTQGGYMRSIALGDHFTGRPPTISVSLIEMRDESAAAAALEAIRLAPGDLPTPGQTPRGSDRALVDDPAITGADASLAFTSSLDGGVVDSGHVVIQVGNRLYTIDVQGAASAEQALAVAVDLATAQAACAADGGDACDTPPIPALTA